MSGISSRVCEAGKTGRLEEQVCLAETQRITERVGGDEDQICGQVQYVNSLQMCGERHHITSVCS